MLRYLFTIAFLTAAGAAQAAAYKCTGPDGSVTFSDMPCPDAPSEQVLLHDEGHEAPLSAGDPLEAQRRMAEEYDRQREAEIQSNMDRRRQAVLDKKARDEWEAKVRDAKMDDRVIEGMTKSDVRDAWGDPDETDITSGSETWRYWRRNGYDLLLNSVTFRDGRVSYWSQDWQP